jgi:uncharacterized protein YkwD
VLAATAALLVSMAGAARPASALTNCSVSDTTFDSEEQQFLQLINQYRAQNGLSSLTVSTNLNRSATWMARDLAVNNYFSHTDSLGRGPNARIVDCDGQPQGGENLAAGTIKDTAGEAFEMWRKSPGHNTNMLYASYKQIGIARFYDTSSTYTWYWVTEFSTTNDGTNTGGSGGGGGATATASPSPSPTPAPQPPAAPVSPLGVMTSPAAGSTLGATATFDWAKGSDASAYYFHMGSSKGRNNMSSVYMGTGTTLTLSGLPKTGWTVYVRLWSLTSSGWQYNDYTYRLSK